MLRIVGSGGEEQKLRALTKELGVEERVEFLGHTSQSDIPNLLTGADIFVRPSRSEGFGNSFVEAMAAGLPVVGTRVGGIPDFLKDGETGLLVAVDDPKDLAVKLELLLNDDGLRDRVARQGQELAVRSYGWDLIAERMNSIFVKLL
jgi:glycosyltransferase involved in cell wall biosynthesis